MRTHPTTNDSTDSQPDIYGISARLDVDAEQLRRFVNRHPSPSVPSVLGFAKANPEEHGDAVRRWLDSSDRHVNEGATPGDELPDDNRLFADGGRFLLPDTGSRVVDSNTDANDELVVIDVFPDRAAENFDIDAVESSVADLNPEYNAAAPVVEAVYVSEVENSLDGWRSVEDLRDAVTLDAINSYHFPAPRLGRGGGE